MPSQDRAGGLEQDVARLRGGGARPCSVKSGHAAVVSPAGDVDVVLHGERDAEEGQGTQQSLEVGMHRAGRVQRCEAALQFGLGDEPDHGDVIGARRHACAQRAEQRLGVGAAPVGGVPVGQGDEGREFRGHGRGAAAPVGGQGSGSMKHACAGSALGRPGGAGRGLTRARASRGSSRRSGCRAATPPATRLRHRAASRVCARRRGRGHATRRADCGRCRRQ